MIKLNNKDITYVALADSNNSVKGVKEIWYADSSNSVKLVYRRKDALIEGEDYEKYHWLVGDADAYINTLKYYRPYDDSVQMTFRDNLYPNRESKYNKYNKEEQIWGACETNNLQSVLIRSYISSGSAPNRFCNNIIDGSTADSAVSWGTYATQNYINESPEHSLYISSINNEDRYYFIYNGNTKNNLPTRYTLPELVQQDVRIFYSGIHDNGYFNGSFFNFIHYRNNVEITHLIPCKLLKPVPKWLDANGIRRQVGECGMIDLVSGKFYGNVNSNGTFTVENYYERKEWLIADIPDNKRCIDLPINSNEMSYSMLISKAGNNTFFETIGNYRYYTTYGTIPSIKVWNISTSSDVGTFNVGLQTNKLFNITSNESSLTINGIGVQKFGFPISAVVLRSGATLGNAITETSSIFVNGVERYIPCTLTMDLPASMDANNIARTKGTSGMWDLVNDRFYGNVANSGTFKAVNLAEGVDYEVHQWLGVKSIYHDAKMMTLDINSYSFSFSRKPLKGSNVPYFYTEEDVYLYSSSANTIRIWNSSQGGYYYSNTPFNWGDTISIVSNSNGLDVNSQVIPQNTFPCKYIFFGAGNDSDTEYYTSSITVDGVERYIPVKLLKSIPAKYDANGIARQAGECGMYDTVNDKFYGNVASSGTFSVSDDE